jgi:NADPH:quinone reductase
MKQIRIYEQGDTDVMKLEDVPIPQPQAGQVLVKNHAIGVNYIDLYKRSGQYKVSNFPFVLGEEAAGTVEAVGDGVTDFAVGDRVVNVFTQGAYSEYMLVAEDKLLRIPEGVSFETACALVIQGMTAHYLAVDTFPLKTGDHAVVHAAAGGTGNLLVQIAKLRGAIVYATVSGEAKVKAAKDAGADHVLFYDDFDAKVRELTDGRGADVVYDSVGKDTYEQSLNALRPRGMFVLYGGASGAVPPFDLLTLSAKGSLYATRPSLGSYIATRHELHTRSSEVFTWAMEGKLNIRIDRVLPLAQAADAHTALSSRATQGKIILQP